MNRSVIAATLILGSLLAVPALAADWTVPGQFPTIQAAVDSPRAAWRPHPVGSGDHAGAGVMKAVEIRGTGNARIVTGPPHPSGKTYGFLIGEATDGVGGDGVTIAQLTFTVDLPVFSRGANDVTVSHNVFLNPNQGVTNRGGSRWDISHNTFRDLRTDNGGGIAIVVADHLGRDVQENLVAHNNISGTLHVAADDLGGYAGTGIVLFADFRWDQLGAASIAYNRVVKNSVALVSDNAPLVDVVAFELTDTRARATHVIYDNAIGFNDFRGTAKQIVLTPETLDADNSISRNLGDNRGEVFTRAFSSKAARKVSSHHVERRHAVGCTSERNGSRAVPFASPKPMERLGFRGLTGRFLGCYSSRITSFISPASRRHAAQGRPSRAGAKKKSPTFRNNRRCECFNARRGD